MKEWFGIGEGKVAKGVTWNYFSIVLFPGLVLLQSRRAWEWHRGALVVSAI